MSLSIGGFVFVDADRCDSSGSTIKFYRGDVVSAEYPKATVLELTESKTLTQRIGIFVPKPKEGDAETGV